jgi:hypothetical protein
MALRTVKRPGPFILTPRLVMLVGGLLAIPLGLFNLFHEFHSAQVDRVYAIVGLVVAAIWLGALVLGFLGRRIGAFLAALIAFVEFGVIASSHFVSGPAALEAYVSQEGLPVATVDMALIPSSMLVIIGAAASWSNLRGRTRRLDMLPMLLLSVIGATLVILQATDAVHRSDFGPVNPQDGAFLAAALATLWVAGGLWIAGSRRIGALIIAGATLGVTFSFATLHLLPGGTSFSQISSESGTGWAVVGAATGVLAGASFLAAMGLLLLSIVRRKPQPPDEIRRRAVRRST